MGKQGFATLIVAMHNYLEMTALRRNTKKLNFAEASLQLTVQGLDKFLSQNSAKTVILLFLGIGTLNEISSVN